MVTWSGEMCCLLAQLDNIIHFERYEALVDSFLLFISPVTLDQKKLRNFTN